MFVRVMTYWLLGDKPFQFGKRKEKFISFSDFDRGHPVVLILTIVYI